MKLNHKCPYCHVIHEQPCVPANDESLDNPCKKCLSLLYSVFWLDSYNTWNHRNENIPAEKDVDEENGVLSKSGLENIKNYSYVFEIEDFDNDGWVGYCHAVKFIANNIEEVKIKTKEILEDNERIIDVWSVSKDGKTLLTEEDFE